MLRRGPGLEHPRKDLRNNNNDIRILLSVRREKTMETSLIIPLVTWWKKNANSGNRRIILPNSHFLFYFQMVTHEVPVHLSISNAVGPYISKFLY